MSTAGQIPQFLHLEAPGGRRAASYGDTTDVTGRTGQFSYKVIGLDNGEAPNPQDSLTSVSGSWEGICRDIHIRDLDSSPGLDARLLRHPVTNELSLVVSDPGASSGHQIALPLRVDGTNLPESSLNNPNLLANTRGMPLTHLVVQVKDSGATITCNPEDGAIGAPSDRTFELTDAADTVNRWKIIRNTWQMVPDRGQGWDFPPPSYRGSWDPMM